MGKMIRKIIGWIISPIVWIKTCVVRKPDWLESLTWVLADTFSVQLAILALSFYAVWFHGLRLGLTVTGLLLLIDILFIVASVISYEEGKPKNNND